MHRTRSGCSGYVLVIIGMLMVAAIWGGEIERLYRSLPWNVVILVAATLSVALGLAVTATLFWKPR